jgi:hypothetical protein
MGPDYSGLFFFFVLPILLTCLQKFIVLIYTGKVPGIIFAPVLYYLSRKAEGCGPMKP